MKQHWSVRTYLWSLALAVALPCAAVIAYSIASDASHDERQVRSTTLGVAQLVAAQTQRFIADAENVLRRLSTRSLFRALDPEQRPLALDGFLDLHPQYANLVLCDENGHVIHSAKAFPPDKTVTNIHANWVEAIIRNGKFTIGKPILGQISQRWVCVLGLPVRSSNDDGLGAIGLAVDLERFQTPAGLFSLPTNSVIAIVDNDGTVIARSLESAKWIGHSGRGAQIVDFALTHTEGNCTALGLDGVERTFGVTTIPGIGWHVYVGIPTSFTFAAVRANAWRAGLVGAALLAIVVALVLALGRQISRPVNELLRATNAAADGKLESNVPTTGPAEIASVAYAFNHLLATRRQKDAELAQLNQKLEQRVKDRTSALESANAELQREVADRIRAEQALSAHRQELQDYIDSMSTFNAKLALDGTVLLVNKTAQQASGLSADDIMKTNFLDGQWWSFDPKVRARVAEAFAKARGGIAVNYDEKIFVYGKIIDINFSLIPVRDSNGEVAYIVAEARDISSLKKAETAVVDRTGALEIANQELEAFSYSVSHDLRAPLRAIEGFAGALQEDAAPQLDDQARGYIHRIRHGVSRMNQLIDGLLNLSRISRSQLNRLPVVLSSLAEEIVGELKESDPGRTVAVAIQPGLTAQADHRLMRVVLGNLLGNAWKFTAKLTHGRIEFRQMVSNGEAVFFVRDNGAGFDMAYRDKLFKVFQRLHSTEEFEGTGIGLATVQRIVRRHGGRAWAEGEPGKGATFYFTLPDEEFNI